MHFYSIFMGKFKNRRKISDSESQMHVNQVPNVTVSLIIIARFGSSLFTSIASVSNLTVNLGFS